MEENREITALFHLIDDPDQEVFDTVSNRILSFGKNIIPNLEHLWENTPQEIIQERIEMLIHRLHFRDLTEEFEKWGQLPQPDLLSGAMLVAKYQFPDLTAGPILQEIEKMRRNIWLELNNYLTGLEQANVLNTILYNYYKLRGTEVVYTEPNDFLINKLLEVKRGNTISNGILLLVFADLLSIPLYAINIPRQFVLGYFEEQYDAQHKLNITSRNQVQFFVDPASGQIFTHQDVNNYFKRINVPPTIAYFKPQNNKRIIQFLLEEFSKCFEEDKDSYKSQELLQLARLLND